MATAAGKSPARAASLNCGLAGRNRRRALLRNRARVFRYLERLVSHQTTFRLLARLRVWFTSGSSRFAPARLGGYHSGDLLSRIGADIDTLENILCASGAARNRAAGDAGDGAFFAALDLRLALALVAYLALAGIGVPL